jgi:hypothetical protein
MMTFTAGNFCLCTTIGNKLTQWYNLDVWNLSSWVKGTDVPITPQPPVATPLADLVCTSCPPACQVEITTV